jgi:hypothetical protein
MNVQRPTPFEKRLAGTRSRSPQIHKRHRQSSSACSKGAENTHTRGGASPAAKTPALPVFAGMSTKPLFLSFSRTSHSEQVAVPPEQDDCTHKQRDVSRVYHQRLSRRVRVLFLGLGLLRRHHRAGKSLLSPMTSSGPKGEDSLPLSCPLPLLPLGFSP